MEEALRQAVADLTVYVHPSNAADVRHAVARQLSSLLFSYEDQFDGVLLAHEITLATPKAKILNGLVPYLGVQVHANVLLFSPKPDMLLEGKVEMLGRGSIHAIVLGVFSAAIMSEDIREKFKFKRKGDGGKFVSRSDRNHVIERGSMIRFSVKSVDTETNSHITGSLVPPHTGCMHWLSIHDAEYASEINRGESEFTDENNKIEQNEQDHRALNNEDSVLKSERRRKSRKRRADEL